MLCWGGVVAADERAIALEADHLTSFKSGELVLASSNVRVSSEASSGAGSWSIQAPALWIDFTHSQVWGTGNIRMDRHGLKMKMRAMRGDFESDEYLLKGAAFERIEQGARLWMSASTLSAGETLYTGDQGKLTTCELPNPHYQVSASMFRYEPDRFIEGRDVWFSGRVFGAIPVAFWLPYYHYELGPRSIVWRMPIVGKKETPGWGWFMQNTIDYDVVAGHKSSVYVDLFERKGVGLGVTHQLRLPDHWITLMGYDLQEQDTGLGNFKWGITDRFRWDNRQVTVNVSQVDAERLTQSGRQNTDFKSIAILEPTVLGRTQWLVTDVRDRAQNLRVLSGSMSNQTGSLETNRVSMIYQDNSVGLRRDSEYLWSHLWWGTDSTRMDTRFDLRRQEVYFQAADEVLESNLSLQQKFSSDISAKVRVDTLAHLDAGNSVDNPGFYRFFYRLPELEVMVKSAPFGVSINHTITVARYQESYLTPASVFRVFPQDQDFGFAPNTFIYSTKTSQSVGDAQKEGKWTLSGGYDQYVFWTGDAMYTLGAKAAYERQLGWVTSQTSVTSLIAPDQNTSPFFQFSDRISAQQQLVQKLSFLSSVYQWDHETGYDWVLQRWQDYRTLLTIYPQTNWAVSVAGGKILSPSSFDVRHEYLPTVFDLRYSDKGVRGRYSIGFDTNEWIYQRDSLIQSSFFTVAFPFGSADPASQWSVDLTAIYNTQGLPRGFDWSRYDLQMFNLTCHDHCQTTTVGYNKLSGEFQFRYTIDAFSGDPIEVFTGPKGFRFGGRLNAASEERF